MSDRDILDKSKVEKLVLEDPETLVETLKNNPALLDYVFSDAEIQRKYVKMTPDVEHKLKQYSDSSGVAEGVLLGAGLALLLYAIFKE